MDPFGRTLNRVDSFHEAGDGDLAAIQTVMTPIRPVDTLYPKLGDLAGNVMLVALAGLLLGLLLGRRLLKAQPESGSVSA